MAASPASARAEWMGRPRAASRRTPRIRAGIGCRRQPLSAPQLRHGALNVAHHLVPGMKRWRLDVVGRFVADDGAAAGAHFGLELALAGVAAAIGVIDRGIHLVADDVEPGVDVRPPVGKGHPDAPLAVPYITCTHRPSPLPLPLRARSAASRAAPALISSVCS